MTTNVSRLTTYDKSAQVVLSTEKLRHLVQRLHRSNKRIVFTNGCFDLIHPGHVELLRQAKALGDVLILGVNSDASVRRLKGPGRPILKLAERLRVLQEFRSIDFIVPFSESTPQKLIEQIRPDVLVKGADWSAGKIVGREFAKKVVRITLVNGLSTTALIARIQKKS